MKTFGIIIEANPLHHGHEYLINEVKSKYHPDILIALVSTYFTMRGDLNCLSKEEKVNELLNSGFDLVFELPLGLSIHRADIFAKNSINILKTLGITHLCFGTEVSDLDYLNNVITLFNKESIKKEFQDEINKQIGYKTALQNILTKYLSKEKAQELSNPNITLGLFYLYHLKDTNIEPILIKRTSSYNEETPSSNITSATAIRNLIRKHDDISNYVSYHNYLDLTKMESKLLNIIKYKLLIENKRPSYDKEGIGNYIANNADFNLTYNNFINNLANKKYSKTRIRRYLINLLLDNDLPYETNTPYLRLLGFNNLGKNYISLLNKDVKNLIFSNPNEHISDEINKYLELELKTSKLFSILNNIDAKEEYKFPLRKDKHGRS